MLLAFLALAAKATLAQSGAIRLANTAKYVGSGRYDWTVYLVAPDSVLRRIDSVEYRLPPSFGNPIRRVSNRSTRFSLSSSAWREFEIEVRTFPHTGKVSYLTHWLRLQPTKASAQLPAPAPALLAGVVHGAVTVHNTSRYAGDGRWDWSVFVVAADTTLRRIKCVEYTLHPTFPDPVRRVCARGTAAGKGFVLNSNGWGTFRIAVRVMFANGDVKSLQHDLQFSPAKS